MALKPDTAAATPEEWDAIEGVAPPRMPSPLIGREAQKASFLDAYGAGRLHHAWALIGPRGVGKATFAYAAARFLLAGPPAPGTTEAASLKDFASVPGVEASGRLIAVGAHPGLFVLRRLVNEKTKRPKAAISVEDVREMIGFFRLSAADGGWRVAIEEAAD